MTFELAVDPGLAAAVERRGKAAAVRVLDAAVTRVQAQTRHLLATFDAPTPAATTVTLVPPGHTGPGVVVDPDRLAGLAAGGMATVILIAVLDTIGDDEAIASDDRPPTTRPKVARHDRDAFDLGIGVANLQGVDVLVHYTPHGSIVRGDPHDAVTEAMTVDDRMSAALDGIPGAEITDNSGWEWHLRIP